MSTAIWWIWCDLRLTDNQTISTALVRSDTIVPVFILDPRLLASPFVGSQRTAFLFAGLRSFDQDLRRLGSQLIISQGDPVEALSAMASETGATAIYAEGDYSPYASQRDARLNHAFSMVLTTGLTVRPPELVLKQDGYP